jgi:hypothetical protein
VDDIVPFAYVSAPRYRQEPANYFCESIHSTIHMTDDFGFERTKRARESGADILQTDRWEKVMIFLFAENCSGKEDLKIKSGFEQAGDKEKNKTSEDLSISPVVKKM